MVDDNREWKIARSAQFVNDNKTADLAWEAAHDNAPADEEPPNLGDFHAARAYLRTGLIRMPFAEARDLTPGAAAALWARGTEGARRYRLSGATSAEPGKRVRRSR